MRGRVLERHHAAETLARATLAPARAYSVMRWSCAGGMRGGDSSMTSPPMTW